MIKYRLMSAKAELGFTDWRGRERAEEELDLGCTSEYDPDPELVAEFDTLEAAQAELEKYVCTYFECKHYGSYKSYEVEEYYIEEVTLNEDGEEINWDYLDYARDEISLKDYKVNCKAKFGNHDSSLSDLINDVLKEKIKARTEEQACEMAMQEIEYIVNETDDYDAEISSYFSDIKVFNEENELIEVYEQFAAVLICD